MTLRMQLNVFNVFISGCLYNDCLLGVLKRSPLSFYETDFPRLFDVRNLLTMLFASNDDNGSRAGVSLCSDTGCDYDVTCQLSFEEQTSHVSCIIGVTWFFTEKHRQFPNQKDQQPADN